MPMLGASVYRGPIPRWTRAYTNRQPDTLRTRILRPHRRCDLLKPQRSYRAFRRAGQYSVSAEESRGLDNRGIGKASAITCGSVLRTRLRHARVLGLGRRRSRA